MTAPLSSAVTNSWPSCERHTALMSVPSAPFGQIPRREKGGKEKEGGREGERGREKVSAVREERGRKREWERGGRENGR